MRPLDHRHLGRLHYDLGLSAQREHRALLSVGEGRRPNDLLLTLEHVPGVLTAGRRAVDEELLLSPEELADRGVLVRHIERGGTWTWHGPGQLVAYPVVDLQRRGLSVPQFVAGMEAAMAAVVRICLNASGLELCGTRVQLGRRCGFPGLWVRAEGFGVRKLGAVGIHLRRMVSLHGLSLNLDPDPWGFSLIQPCGMDAVETSSVARLIGVLGGDAGCLPNLEALSHRLAVILPQCWASPEDWPCPRLDLDATR